MTKKKWPEIWATLRDAFATPFKERTEKQRELTTYSDGSRAGICRALYKFGFSGSVGVAGSLNPCYWPHGGFWYFRTDRGDLKRMEFCDFMSGLSHEDFEDFINGRIR